MQTKNKIKWHVFCGAVSENNRLHRGRYEIDRMLRNEAAQRK